MRHGGDTNAARGAAPLQRLAQLIEQAGILDRDDGLVGEVFDQLDLLIRERPNLLAVDGDGTDQFIRLEHWYKEVGSRAGRFDEVDEAGIAFDIAWFRHEVGNINNASRCGKARKRVTRIIADRKDGLPVPSLSVSGRGV